LIADRVVVFRIWFMTSARFLHPLVAVVALLLVAIAPAPASAVTGFGFGAKLG